MIKCSTIYFCYIAPDNTNALIAEGRAQQVQFGNQSQELLSLTQHCNQQAANRVNLIALFNQTPEESSNHERWVGIKTADLSQKTKELREKTKEVSSLQGDRQQRGAD